MARPKEQFVFEVVRRDGAPEKIVLRIESPESTVQTTIRLLDGPGGALMKDLDADRLILATSASDEIARGSRAWA